MRHLAYALLTALTLSSCQAVSTNGSVGWLRPEAEYFKPALRVYFDTGRDDEGELDVFKDGSISPSVDFLGITFPYMVLPGIDPSEGQSVLDTTKTKKAESLQDLEDARRNRDEARAELVLVRAERERATEQAELQSLSARESQLTSDWESAQNDLRIAEIDAEAAENREKRVEEKVQRQNGSRLDGDWVFGPRLSLGLTSPASGVSGDSGSGDTAEASGAPVVYVGAGLFFDFNKSGSLFEDDGVGVRAEVGYVYGVSTDESLDDADDGAVYVGLTVNL